MPYFVNEEEIGLQKYKDNKWICPLVDIWGNKNESRKFIISEEQKDSILSYHRFLDGTVVTFGGGMLCSLSFSQWLLFIIVSLTILVITMYVEWKIIEITLNGEKFIETNQGENNV